MVRGFETLRPLTRCGRAAVWGWATVMEVIRLRYGSIGSNDKSGRRAAPSFFVPCTLVRTWGTRRLPSGLLDITEPALFAGVSSGRRTRAVVGLRPSFSSHVRWCEHGAPVDCL